MGEIYLAHPSPPPFVEILADLEGPELMIVMGGLDDFELRVSQKYADVIGENAEVWLIDNAWHVGGPNVIPEEYSKRMLEFFETELRE
ncbi:MAG: hypothetical protein JEZ06_18240 [Anaerolineaceae bacterium]|nr:hypothetical protein [Anaerolineaceae bacterium]